MIAPGPITQIIERAAEVGIVLHRGCDLQPEATAGVIGGDVQEKEMKMADLSFVDAEEKAGFIEWVESNGTDRQELAELALGGYPLDRGWFETLLMTYRSAPVTLIGGPCDGQQVRVYPKQWQYGVRLDNGRRLATYLLTDKGWCFSTVDNLGGGWNYER